MNPPLAEKGSVSVAGLHLHWWMQLGSWNNRRPRDRHRFANLGLIARLKARVACWERMTWNDRPLAHCTSRTIGASRSTNHRRGSERRARGTRRTSRSTGATTRSRVQTPSDVREAFTGTATSGRHRHNADDQAIPKCAGLHRTDLLSWSAAKGRSIARPIHRKPPESFRTRGCCLSARIAAPLPSMKRSCAVGVSGQTRQPEN